MLKSFIAKIFCLCIFLSGCACAALFEPQSERIESIKELPFSEKHGLVYASNLGLSYRSSNEEYNIYDIYKNLFNPAQGGNGLELYFKEPIQVINGRIFNIIQCRKVGETDYSYYFNVFNLREKKSNTFYSVSELELLEKCEVPSTEEHIALSFYCGYHDTNNFDCIIVPFRNSDSTYLKKFEYIFNIDTYEAIYFGEEQPQKNEDEISFSKIGITYTSAINERPVLHYNDQDIVLDTNYLKSHSDYFNSLQENIYYGYTLKLKRNSDKLFLTMCGTSGAFFSGKYEYDAVFEIDIANAYAKYIGYIDCTGGALCGVIEL